MVEEADFYALVRLFAASNVWGGPSDPPAVRPLTDLELRGKKEHIALNERKPMVPNFKVSGQPMPSDVRTEQAAAGRLT